MSVGIAVVEGQTDSAVSTSNTATRVSPEVQIPNGFMPEAPKDFRVLHDYGPDTELWLVRVPHEFDPFVLHQKLKASTLVASGSQTIKVKNAEAQKQYYAAHTYRELDKSQRMSLVVAGDDNNILLGQDVKNMLVITKIIKTPESCHHSKRLTEKKPVPLPEGLKVRFTTFGTETPICSQQETKKSKKRKRKREHDLSEVSDDITVETAADRSYAPDLPSPHSKSQVRRAGEWNGSLEAGLDALEQSTSPPRKKRKKNKQPQFDPDVASLLMNSESCNFTSGSGSPLEVPKSDAPRKEKKRKKHKHRESDSVTGGVVDSVGRNHEDSAYWDLFMVDRAGDRGLNLNSSTLSEKGAEKHKVKSKKDEKRRRTFM